MFVPTPSNQILFQGPLPLLFFTPFTFSIFLQVTFNPKHPIPPQFTRNCYANVNRPLGFPQSHFPSAAMGVGVRVVGSPIPQASKSNQISHYMSLFPRLQFVTPWVHSGGKDVGLKRKKKVCVNSVFRCDFELFCLLSRPCVCFCLIMCVRVCAHRRRRVSWRSDAQRLDLL